MTVPTELLTRLRVQAWDAESLGHWQIANTLRDTAKTLSERYVLVSDNDAHKYVIPAEKAATWSAWLEIPSDDERAWEPPAFARPIDGCLTFLDPRS